MVHLSRRCAVAEMESGELGFVKKGVEEMMGTRGRKMHDWS